MTSARIGERFSGCRSSVSGFYQAVLLGLRSFAPANRPQRWRLVVWAVCAWTVVTLYLPMAWDRYQLPIQSGNALLAAVGLSALWDRLAAAARSGLISRGLLECPSCCVSPPCWVFFILLGSNAFFWHTRDWNTASRLMLTYSLVDRGRSHHGPRGANPRQGQISGRVLFGQATRLRFSRRCARTWSRSWSSGIPSHPLNEPVARRYWAADYWVTLFTSGLFTASPVRFWSTGRAALVAGRAARRSLGLA